MKAIHVYYEGSVQGVGFRWTTRRIAQGYEVTGWVRNLPDGRVEMQVAGDEALLFLKAIRESSLAGNIFHEAASEIDVPKPFKGFHIVA